MKCVVCQMEKVTHSDPWYSQDQICEQCITSRTMFFKDCKQVI